MHTQPPPTEHALAHPLAPHQEDSPSSPDKNEYRRVELDLPKKIAQISKSNDIKSFIKNLIKCDDNDYFEKGLELCISDDNKKIKAVDISEFNCVEIDFVEDLHEANKNL